MSSITKKLNELSNGKVSEWAKEAEWQIENQDRLARSGYVALQILSELKRKGWTQAFLADKMGVSAQYISKVLKGEENLSFDTVANIGKALGIKLKTDVPEYSTEVIITKDVCKIHLHNFRKRAKDVLKADAALLIDENYWASTQDNNSGKLRLQEQ